MSIHHPVQLLKIAVCFWLSYLSALFILVTAAWNRDWKPGAYPETPEEREAAAKKYGMRVEDYEPYDPYEGMLRGL